MARLMRCGCGSALALVLVFALIAPAAHAAGVFGLSVSANPEAGVSITVTPLDTSSFGSGVTPFVRTYDDGTSISLTAPAFVNTGSGVIHFVRWQVNNSAKAAGVRKFTFTIGRDTTAVAVYETAHWALSVSSSDPIGIRIVGPPSGTTDYTKNVRDLNTITLTAPSIFVDSSHVRWFFARWVFNGRSQTRGVTSFTFRMRRDSTLEARYHSVTALHVSGPTAVKENSTTQFRARAIFSDGATEEVTTRAVWSSSTSLLSFPKRGLLHAGTVGSTTTRSFLTRFSGVRVSTPVKVVNR